MGMHRKNESLLKAVLTLKIVIVAGVLAVENNWLTFGDATVEAQQQSTQAPASSDETAREAPVKSGRRGFLDDLLNLPKIDTTDLRREDISRYLNLIERRQQQVEERIALLQSREALLQELEDSIEQKLKHLEEERRFFTESVQHEKQIKAERLEQLVEFYRGMGPKQSAPVFEKLDQDLVVHLFNELPEKQVMAILGAMDPDRSVEITEYYGRLRSGREYDLLKEVNASLVEAFQDCKGQPQ